MRVAGWIIASIVSALGLSTAASTLDVAEVDDIYPRVPVWRGAMVLHIGDSHVSGGLRAGLRRHIEEAGAGYRPVCWVGSRSKSWVTSGKLEELLEEHRPTVVVVTLGTNELKEPLPARQASWVRALVQRVAPRACYWIGPPPLIDDAFGLNDMVRHNVRPCRYFDSRVLGIPPREDGKFHLSRSQGEAWAAAIWSWMNGD